MIRFNISPAFIFGLLFLCVSGALLFFVSQENQIQRNELARINEAIEAEKSAIRMMEAEWAYLNKPERIEALIAKYTRSKNGAHGGEADQSLVAQARVMQSIPKIEAIDPPKRKPVFQWTHVSRSSDSHRVAMIGKAGR